MHKLIHRISSVTIAACVMLQSGCVQQKPLEKLGLITAVGYDLAEDNSIMGTKIIHKFDPMMQNITEVMTETSNTSKEIRQELNLQSSHKLVSGQLRVVIYSKDLAKRGIIQMIDTLNRDPTIGNMVYVTVCDGKAQDLLKKNNIQKSLDLGTYLYNLVRQNIEGETLISPTLQQFNHNFYDVGRDPALPVFTLSHKNIVISSLGLFKDDRLIGKLDTHQMFFLKLLIDQFEGGAKELAFNPERFNKFMIQTAGHRRDVRNKLFITIDNISSNHKIKLIDKERMRFKIKINIKSRILEITEPLDVGNPAAIKFIEKEISRSLKKDMAKMLNRFQELGVDPVGFGNEYQAHVRGPRMTKKEWRKKFKHASFDIEIDNKITRTGVVD